MREYEPAPFEIALVAAILTLRSAHRDMPQAGKDCIEEAYQLLMHANEMPDVKANELFGWQRPKTYSFDEILKEIEPPTPGRKKKGRTMLGPITKESGLVKALRRVLPTVADEAIKGKRLDSSHIAAIKADQEKRAKTKTLAAIQANQRRKKPAKKNR